jgi:hypothetical protein
MRGQHEGLQVFSGTYKIPANSRILMMLPFSIFQVIYSGAARLLHFGCRYEADFALCLRLRARSEQVEVQ